MSQGASVAINGTCLTVTAIDESRLSFDIISETLRRTNLGKLGEGSAVNFERSARMGDEIGGHTVSGHVHTTASISAIERREDDVRMQFTLQDPLWRKYILPKGFVAVDGCSLTVGEVCARLPGWAMCAACGFLLRLPTVTRNRAGRRRPRSRVHVHSRLCSSAYQQDTRMQLH